MPPAPPWLWVADDNIRPGSVQRETMIEAFVKANMDELRKSHCMATFKHLGDLANADARITIPFAPEEMVEVCCQTLALVNG